MKLSILLEILTRLLSTRKITAADLTADYGFSARTAYRYIEILSTVVPLQIKRGRNGGASLADNYKLPTEFLTATEYEALSDALTIAYTQTAQSRFLTTRQKITAQEERERRRAVLTSDGTDIFVYDAENNRVSENLLSLQECIQDRCVVLIHTKKQGKTQAEHIEPHALVYNGKAWRLFAFNLEERAFHSYFIADMGGVFRTEDHFRKRPFKRLEALKEPPAPTDGTTKTI